MLIPITDAAVILGIGRTNIYALLKRGELRSVKIGGRRLIPRQALGQNPFVFSKKPLLT